MNYSIQTAHLQELSSPYKIRRDQSQRKRRKHVSRNSIGIMSPLNVSLKWIYEHNKYSHSIVHVVFYISIVYFLVVVVIVFVAVVEMVTLAYGCIPVANICRMDIYFIFIKCRLCGRFYIAWPYYSIPNRKCYAVVCSHMSRTYAWACTIYKLYAYTVVCINNMYKYATSGFKCKRFVCTDVCIVQI